VNIGANIGATLFQVLRLSERSTPTETVVLYSAIPRKFLCRANQTTPTPLWNIYPKIGRTALILIAYGADIQNEVCGGLISALPKKEGDAWCRGHRVADKKRKRCGDAWCRGHRVAPFRFCSVLFISVHQRRGAPLIKLFSSHSSPGSEQNR
jgi:hypothetical protein